MSLGTSFLSIGRKYMFMLTVESESPEVIANALATMSEQIRNGNFISGIAKLHADGNGVFKDNNTMNYTNSGYRDHPNISVETCTLKYTPWAYMADYFTFTPDKNKLLTKKK